MEPIIILYINPLSLCDTSEKGTLVMPLQTTTLEKLQTLEIIYRQGYQNHLVDQTLSKILDLERHTAERDCHDLQDTLRQFETQYHLSSEEFYRRFQHGELGDEGDYFEWSACYDMYQTLSQRRKLLDEPA